jgi:hypothetical protein
VHLARLQEVEVWLGEPDIVRDSVGEDRCKTPPPGLLTHAAALLAGINTDEYLYLKFTVNAQRGTLLYALNARSPGYAIETPWRAWVSCPKKPF